MTRKAIGLAAAAALAAAALGLGATAAPDGHSGPRSAGGAAGGIVGSRGGGPWVAAAAIRGGKAGGVVGSRSPGATSGNAALRSRRAVILRAGVAPVWRLRDDVADTPSRHGRQVPDHRRPAVAAAAGPVRLP